MSQAGTVNAGSPSPPGNLNQLTPDTGGVVTPVAGNINVFGKTSALNVSNGIQTAKNGAGELDIRLTNRAVGSVTTTGAVTTPVITLPLGAVPGTYTFDITVAAFATSGIGAPLGAGFTIVGAIRTTGAAATLIPTQVVDHFEEGALGGTPEVLAMLNVSGNNAVVNVTGVSDGAAGFVIDWVATLLYTFAS